MDTYEEKASHFFQEGRYREAIKELENQQRLMPPDAVVQSNLCYLYSLTGQHDRAASCGRQAIELDPAFSKAYTNLGIALSNKGEFAAAMDVLNRGLQVDSQDPSLWSSLGLACSQIGEIARAQHCQEQAIKCNPCFVEAYCNLGILLQSVMEPELAVRYFAEAVKLKPDYQVAIANYMMGLQYLSDLSVQSQMRANDLAAAGFPELSAQRPTSVSNGKIRVGFVSADFCQHPVGFFLHRLFAQSRAADYEFVALDNRSRQDDLNSKLRRLCDHWIEIGELGDQEAADRIRELQINVLVDLSGYTTGTRIGLFAHRPAPIQVSWLGYFASTGLNYMDFVLLGQDQVSPGAEHYYSEPIHVLAAGQFNYAPGFEMALGSGLPEDRQGRLTLGCFNNPAKINRTTIALWVDILQAIPGSVLLLKWKTYTDPEVARRIRARFASLGLADDRLVIEGASPHHELLARYSSVDIALDTFPFSGALTTCEALWMGVPVVSCKSLRPVSRQSYSILKAIGLEDLAVDTPRQYKLKVLELAGDRARREELRAALREKMASAEEQNTPRLAAELEKFVRGAVLSDQS